MNTRRAVRAAAGATPTGTALARTATKVASRTPSPPGTPMTMNPTTQDSDVAKITAA